MVKIIFLLYLGLLAITCYGQSLQNIESVEYDAVNNRFFVSNSNSIIQRSSNGTLSYFGNGAASYGMEVMGNTLFVIQGSGVYGYDLTSEQEVMSIIIPGASFLNGMTNNGVDKIYVTDFSSSKIHEINVSDLSNPTTQVIVANTNSTPNGIVYDAANNRLIFVNWGSNAPIKAVDLSDNSVSTLTTTPYGNIDGIDEDNDGNYYISYWSSGSHISKYDADFANAPETITVSGISNPADICYAKEIDTLAIPHSGNQLTFLSFPSDNPCQNGLWDYELGETWVDCGGDCGDCPPHANGCQDEGESGVDCGGSTGIDCSSLCNDGLPNGWESAVLGGDGLPFDCTNNQDPIDFLSDNFVDFTDCGVSCQPCASDNINENNKRKYQLSVYPNPINNESSIYFTLDQARDVTISIYDLQGKLLNVLMQGTQVEGKHQVLLLGISLPPVSMLEFTVDGQLTVYQLRKN